jgi:hypothetical protein
MRLRHALGPVAVTWLVCHLVSVVLADVILSGQRAGAASDVVCACQHGEGRECPMHKTASGKAGCAMRGSSDDGALSVITLLGPPGLLPFSTQTGTSDACAGALVNVRSDPFDRSTPPASPPPRI